MGQKIDWERQVGRRFKLRDLHVFFTVGQCGSMAKAARELGVSQPAVSEIIANLEHAVGARLLDRSPQGVELTIYGRALTTRSIAVFDELKQSVKDIEFLSDPTRGELRMGCSESIAPMLSPVVEDFCDRYPGVTLDIDYMSVPVTQGLAQLRDRKFDVLLTRVRTPPPRHSAIADDLNVENLFDDRLVIAVGARSPLAKRRRIDLAALADERWILPAAGIWGQESVTELFQANAVPMPSVSIVTFSVPLRIDLVASGKFITALPKSLAERYALKILPVDLPVRPWPVALITLKKRTQSQVVERFIKHVRTKFQGRRDASAVQPLATERRLSKNRR